MWLGDSYCRLCLKSELFCVAVKLCLSVNQALHNSTTVGKRGVQIGKNFVFYNPHIQKIAKTQRRQKLCLKRGQLRMYLGV